MRKGITLAELAIVILILSILTVGIIGFARNLVLEAKVSKFESILNEVKRGVDYFYKDTGCFPRTLKELWENVDGVRNWYGPYFLPPGVFRISEADIEQIQTPLGRAYLQCDVNGGVIFRVLNADRAGCLLLDKDLDDGDPDRGRIIYDTPPNECYIFLDIKTFGASPAGRRIVCSDDPLCRFF